MLKQKILRCSKHLKLNIATFRCRCIEHLTRSFTSLVWKQLPANGCVTSLLSTFNTYHISQYAVFKVHTRWFSSANGDGEIRTLDPLLARQVLSQLSYTPIDCGIHLLSRAVSSKVPSAAYVLTIVFGMGTGVSHKRIDTTNLSYLLITG